MNSSIIYIFKKMCSYVNVNYEDIDFNENDWYFKYEWSEEQEKDFISWLSNEVRTNNIIRKELTSLQYKPSKKKSYSFAINFNLMFGWKTKENYKK